MRAQLASVVVVAAALASSCLVDRKSERFHCGEGGACPAGRRCDDGYCVAGLPDAAVAPDSSSACPSPCDTCDLDARTCQVTCSSANECSSMACPVGYDCTFNCISNSACDAIDCGQARACTVACAGNNACGPITCGPGSCNISCATAASCSNIDCQDACSCDVTCSDCGSLDCPRRPDGVSCTTDGSNNAPCTSAPDGCDRCP